MRDGYADTPKGQVHYVTEGEGEPLVLLHKSPRSARMYRRVIPLLSPRYKVCALDMLGYGYSHPSPKVDDVLLALAENIVEVFDALEIEKAHLFGLHTGAAVAAETAAGWPDRLASLTLFSFPILDDEAREIMQKVHRSYGGYKTWGSEGDGTHLGVYTGRWRNAHAGSRGKLVEPRHGARLLRCWSVVSTSEAA